MDIRRTFTEGEAGRGRVVICWMTTASAGGVLGWAAGASQEGRASRATIEDFLPS
jgi:hypothetical protein